MSEPKDPVDPKAPDAKKRRMVQNRDRVGLAIVNTGNGKGKSTSAFGVAIRAAGHGMKVHIVQFIKGSRDYGELVALERFPEITVERAGEGFTWEVRSDERQKELATWGMKQAMAAVDAGDLDVLILDEVNIALSKGFYATDDLIRFLDERPPELHVICTGRYAPDALIERADLVTEMALIKHPFEKGIRAQPGVEF